MLEAWRLTSARRAETAFTGDGSVLQSGRWHHAGTRCIYVSSALSLAALEVMVHSGGGRPTIPFVAFRVEIPDGVPIAEVPDDLLGEDWRATPAPPSPYRDSPGDTSSESGLERATRGAGCWAGRNNH